MITLRRNIITTTVLLLLLCIPHSVLAQETPGLIFSRTFIGVCVQDFPDIDRVKVAAATFKWKEINDPDLRAMIGPADPAAKWQSWILVQDNETFIVGISESIAENGPVRTCSLVQDRTDVDGIITQLTSMLRASKLNESIEVGQRYTVWQFRKNDSTFLLMTTDGTPMNMMSINASIVTDFRVSN